MSQYWMIAVLIAVLFGGLSDVSRIQKLEAQNQDLIARLSRLERAQPKTTEARREDLDQLDAAEPDEAEELEA